jgi:hypothetical protein
VDSESGGAKGRYPKYITAKAEKGSVQISKKVAGDEEGSVAMPAGHTPQEKGARWAP